MTTTVIFTAGARLALIHIAELIAQDNEEAAFRLVADLEKRVRDTLSLFPEAGAKAQAGRRFLTIRRYTTVYRYDAATNTVFVVDIHGPGMDWR